MTIVIGIDFGTSNSSVGVFQNGTVCIIENDIGSRTTPSFVAFSQNGRQVGDEAKWQFALNPENTIFNFKRLIGRRFDQRVEDISKNLPFQVSSGIPGGSIKIPVLWKNKERQLCPEEVCATILKNLRHRAEKVLEQEITDAVIAVPSSFTDAQRQATIDAAAIAGLNVLRLVNETSSAAIAYGMAKRNVEDRNVLVFNMGGGFLDVSVVTITDYGSYVDYKVRTSASDDFLGGDDFDNSMVSFIVNKLSKEYKKDITKRALSKLKIACETAKKTLSCSSGTVIQVESLLEGYDFNTWITRDEFETLNSDLFTRILYPVEKALRGSKIAKSEISDVILVGGSTRIPKIQNMLKEYFDGKELCFCVNADEGVVYGTSVLAATIKQGSLLDENILLHEINTRSLGFGSTGGVMKMLIERNVPIPCSIEHIFTTTQDNATCICYDIFDGENPMTRDNNYQGDFCVTGINKESKGVPKLVIKFKLDYNNCLKLSATVEGKKVKITRNSFRLSEEEIKELANDLKKFDEEECEHRRKTDARNRLEGFIFKVKQEVEESILKACDDALKWTDENQSAEASEYLERLNQLRSTCTLFLQRLDEP